MREVKWNDGIAIIGMSARFPKARNVDEFWARILSGEPVISDFDDDHLRSKGVPEALLDSPDYVRKGVVLEDCDCFDAKFFGYSNREAEIIDPQQRVFLECAWAAMENAGYAQESGESKIGVFAGVGMNTYLLANLAQNPDVIASAGPYQIMVGNDKDYLASRVAYKLNLHGPAVVVQTACSTSLVAVHMACRAILSGDCDSALAGGVSITFPNGTGYAYVPGMILSPDGNCRPFDSQAKGTVPGGGAGVVFLKRLSMALADGDNVIAVIRGSAANNDGSNKVGYTAPSVDGQADAIEHAYAAAGISPRKISYIEAHGTGTELGDPIETAALSHVYRKATNEKHFCALGSVKALMGHADAAAGVAGIIKCALAVHHGIIPPSPYFKSPNPATEINDGPFYVNKEQRTWPVHSERWGAVSSFGIGGTNAHLCLTNTSQKFEVTEEDRLRVFVLSAKSDTALTMQSEQLAQCLEEKRDVRLDDTEFTLRRGRRTFEWRRSIVASNRTDLIKNLRSTFTAVKAENVGSGVVMLLPGQGEQYAGMVRSLYANIPPFREQIDAGAAILTREFGIDVLQWICAPDSTEAIAEALRKTSNVQPALFLVEYCLAQLWLSAGVKPSVMLAHSLGELTAATIAGVFRFEDGLRLAAERGRLMQDSERGAMLAVALSAGELSARLGPNLWLSSDNGPKMSVTGGAPNEIAALRQELTAEGIFTLQLPVENAFHTPFVAAAAEQFEKKVAAVERRAPTLVWGSNVAGDLITPAEAMSPSYWASQITSCVRFRENIAAVLKTSKYFIEAGPGEMLLGLVRHQLPAASGSGSIGSKNRIAEDDYRCFLQSLGRAWESGVAVDWSQSTSRTGRRVPLPTYPFERKRCWVEASKPSTSKVKDELPKQSSTSAVQAGLANWFYAPTWKRTLPPNWAASSVATTVNSWLVLMEESGLSERVASLLEDEGHRVVRLHPGDHFSKTRSVYHVRPTVADDYDALWQDLKSAANAPAGILNFWAVQHSGVDAFDSLLCVFQAAVRNGVRLVQVEIISDQLLRIGGENVREPVRGEVLGLSRAIAAEYSKIHSRIIDVVLDVGDLTSIVELIIGEVKAPQGTVTVAYRDGQRWQMAWEPANTAFAAPIPLRQRGVYVITGGLGGIGLAVAEFLASEYKARLVLVSRTELPPREQWSRNTPKFSGLISKLLELEAKGAEVMACAADVADVEAMRNVVERALSRFGVVNGVIHAAGVAGGRMISAEELENSHFVRKPKVRGAMCVAELMRQMPLDFFLVCSSISSIQVTAAEASYAAANSFLDCFADYCRQTYKVPAVSINFSAWRDVGMAVKTEIPEEFEDLREERLRNAISPEEGVQAVIRALSWPASQVLVSKVPFDGGVATSKNTSTLSTEPTEQLPAADTDDADAIELTIVDIWEELLANENIGPDDNFFELGGHSLIGTMMLSRIRERCGVQLTLRSIFESPTPRSLAHRIRTQQPERTAVPAVVAASEEREEFEF